MNSTSSSTLHKALRPDTLTDPYLNEAGVVLLGADLPLAKILTADTRFRLIYQDSMAVVFAKR